jgi:hypothetical protein
MTFDAFMNIEHCDLIGSGLDRQHTSLLTFSSLNTCFDIAYMHPSAD